MIFMTEAQTCCHCQHRCKSSGLEG